MCNPHGENKWCDFSCEMSHECGVPDELEDTATGWWNSEKAAVVAPVEDITDRYKKGSK